MVIREVGLSVPIPTFPILVLEILSPLLDQKPTVEVLDPDTRALTYSTVVRASFCALSPGERPYASPVNSTSPLTPSFLIGLVVPMPKLPCKIALVILVLPKVIVLLPFPIAPDPITI